MPILKRYKTKYIGVFFILGKSVLGKKERIYYIRYRKQGRMIEEKVGRQFKDDMTPSRAANIRVKRIEGDQLSNAEKREEDRIEKQKETKKMTIQKLWEQYKVNKPEIKGIKTDKSRFKNYIKPSFGNKEPRELFPLDIDRIRIKLLKNKSPGTVKNILELLNRIINFGIKKNLCKGLNFKIEMPKVNNIKTEDLTPEQLSRLIEEIDHYSNIQVANLMRMALFTGMRRGELFKLKWKDVDFISNFIYIRDPKGGIDQKIPLNEISKKLLMNHPHTGSVFVFPGRSGNQRTDINKQVNKIKNCAGLPKNFRPLHGLRHVYASMLASSGKVDMYTLQKLLTHKSPQMTQRYAHLRDETLKKASNIAGNIFEQFIDKDENIISIKKTSG